MASIESLEEVNIPTNVAVCAISIDVLHKLLRLPDGVEIILLRQDKRDSDLNQFRLALRDEAFSIMNVPLNDDGTRAEAPQVTAIYDRNENDEVVWAGWTQLTEAGGEDLCQL